MLNNKGFKGKRRYLTNMTYICYNIHMNIKSIKNIILVGTLAVLFINSHIASASVYFAPMENSQLGGSNNEKFDELPTWTPTQNHNVSSNGTAFYAYPENYYAPPTTVQPRTQSPVNTVATNTSTKRTVVISNTNQHTARTNTPMYYTTQANSQLMPVVTTQPQPMVSTTNSDLAALSLNGSGGFMPSSIWQWFLVILLILGIIIITRMIGRSEHHDVHTVAMH